MAQWDDGDCASMFWKKFKSKFWLLEQILSQENSGNVGNKRGRFLDQRNVKLPMATWYALALPLCFSGTTNRQGIDGWTKRGLTFWLEKCDFISKFSAGETLVASECHAPCATRHFWESATNTSCFFRATMYLVCGSHTETATAAKFAHCIIPSIVNSN